MNASFDLPDYLLKDWDLILIEMFGTTTPDWSQISNEVAEKTLARFVAFVREKYYADYISNSIGVG